MKNLERRIGIVLIILLLLASACGAASIPSTTPTKPSTVPTNPSQSTIQTTNPISQGTIQWNEASKHVGERITVCGEVISTEYAFTSKGSPTFLNIGKGYPDPKRFTIVIWGTNRSKFSPPPEFYYKSKNVCVTGLITTYAGVPQIEVTNPSQITFK